MANFFDQFDAPAANLSAGNFFDRFDNDPSGVLSPEQMDSLARARARVANREPAPAPHNAPSTVTGLPTDDVLANIRTGVGGFIEGIPIAGPIIRGGVDRAAAATLAGLSDKSYGEVLDIIQNATREEKEASPYLDTGAKVAGAVAGTVPMIAAAPGAFGVGAGSLAMRSGASAATGASIGLADSAVRSGGDPAEMAQGAMAGFVGGGLGPAAGQLVGASAQKVAQWLSDRGIRSVSDLAPAVVERIARLAEADGLDAAAVRQRLSELGDSALVADLGPNLQQNAAALATRPGQPRTIVQDAIGAREQGANQRILSAMDENLGPAPIPSRLTAGIWENQKALSPAYEEVFANARRVDTQPIADTLDSMVVNLRGDAQSAARQAREMLNITGESVLDPNPRTLFATREAIDGMLETVADPKVRQTLTDIRRQVDGTLASSVPGLKAVDARYAELARQREAFERGQTLLSNGQGAVRPQELADELLGASVARGEAIGPSAVPLRLREGARAEMDRIVGTNANDRRALAGLIRGDGDWNPQKLRLLFGQERADRMLGVLDAERVFAETAAAVNRGGLSGARSQAMQDIAGSPEPGITLLNAYRLGGTPAVARTGALRVWEALRAKSKDAKQEAANVGMAMGLTTRPSRIVEALRLLEKRPNVRPAVDRVTRALLLAPAVGR